MDTTDTTIHVLICSTSLRGNAPLHSGVRNPGSSTWWRAPYSGFRGEWGLGLGGGLGFGNK